MKKNVAKNIFVWSMIILLAFSSGIFLAQMYLDLQDTNSASADITDPYGDSTTGFTFLNGKNNTFYGSQTNIYDFVVSGDSSSYNIAFKFGMFTYVSSSRVWVYNVNSSFSSSAVSTISFSNPLNSSGLLQSRTYHCHQIDTSTVLGGSYDQQWLLSYTLGSQVGFSDIAYVSYGMFLVSNLSDNTDPIIDFYWDSSWIGSGNQLGNTTTVFVITFTDVNGCKLSWIYSTWLGSPVVSFEKYRTYYVYSVDKNSADYLNGFNAGLAVSSQEQYDLGYQNGKDVGIGIGYNRGIQAANDYSFLGLLGAVVDAPIAAFTGLFNFELLGINLKDFLAGLFTICIIIVVVRLILVK